MSKKIPEEVAKTRHSSLDTIRFFRKVNMLQLRSFENLSGGDFEWLKAKHHFAVDGRFSKTNSPIGSLVVLNDDEVAPGSGFPMHGHKDMEIVTYLVEGSLIHEDSTGARGELSAGDVQAFSAGSGIQHSERNHGADWLHIFQLWLRPRRRGTPPQWATRKFPKSERAGHLVTLASGYPSDVDAIQIDSEARVLGATLESGQQLNFRLSPDEQAYLVLAKGAVTVNELQVNARDGLAISQEPILAIAAREPSEIILVVTSSSSF